MGNIWTKMSFRTRIALIQELGAGELTDSELGEKYGITKDRVGQIRRENADKIAAMRADVEDELAGVFIASKANRIKTYDHLAALLDEAITAGQEPDPQLVRQLIVTQKAVAEEMGQLPSRITIQHVGPRADYTIEGVDPKDLT